MSGEWASILKVEHLSRFVKASVKIDDFETTKYVLGRAQRGLSDIFDSNQSDDTKFGWFTYCDKSDDTCVLIEFLAPYEEDKRDNQGQDDDHRPDYTPAARKPIPLSFGYEDEEDLGDDVSFSIRRPARLPDLPRQVKRVKHRVNNHNNFYEYQLQTNLKLLDMSSIHTIEYLINHLDLDVISDVFNIDENQTVRRNSTLSGDLRLAKALVDKKIVDGTNCHGWYHDTMQTKTGGRHNREILLFDPRSLVITPPTKIEP